MEQYRKNSQKWKIDIIQNSPLIAYSLFLTSCLITPLFLPQSSLIIKMLNHVYLVLGDVPTWLCEDSKPSILCWFYKKVLQRLSSPGNTFWPLFPKGRLPLSSNRFPNPNPLGFYFFSPNSSSPFMIIILARSPPKVLLGLKPPDSLVAPSPQNLGFLKGGIYLRQKVEGGVVLGVLLLIDQTYWKSYQQFMMGLAMMALNLPHSRACWSVFLRVGRKTLSTKLRKAATSFFSLFMVYKQMIQSTIKQQKVLLIIRLPSFYFLKSSKL